MRCPRCSADNLAGLKFCGQCGAPLGVPCPSCGSGNPPEHRFCGHCGAALGQTVCRKPFRVGHSSPNPPQCPGLRFPAK